MVATKSKMLPLGIEAPAFELIDPRKNDLVKFSSETNGTGFLIAFICNHCPYVIHLKQHFPALFNNWIKNGIKIYAISSNDSAKYPADSPQKMASEAEKLGFDFPYLYDESQEVAKHYQAACTPDFFLFDQHKRLFYRGRYDGSKPGGKEEVTGCDLSDAVARMLGGELPPSNQIPSLGCNIKWR